MEIREFDSEGFNVEEVKLPEGPRTFNTQAWQDMTKEQTNGALAHGILTSSREWHEPLPNHHPREHGSDFPGIVEAGTLAITCAIERPGN